ncbi:MAG: shikimate kinase [Balneolales bacterium]
MKTPEHILICGFMAAGKSSLGRLIAFDLKKPFFDLDRIIERDEGKSIKDIFNEQGEPFFRELEIRYLKNLMEGRSSVIALGGGTLQNENVVNQIKENNYLVYLDVPLPIIIKRLTKNKTRPLLYRKDGTLRNEKELKTYIYELHNKREYLYRQSHLCIKFKSNWNRNTAAGKVAQHIREYVHKS